MEKIEKVISYFKSKNGKRNAFFIFYFFFFTFLFFYIKNNDLQKKVETNENKENIVEEFTSNFETNKLENSDYLYKIIIQNNEEIEILEGSRGNNENIANHEYFEFLDLNEIKRIIKNSKYLSKSLYNTDEHKVNYEITNNDLYRLFDKKIDSEELNNIVLTVDKNNDLKNIELVLSNYIKSINDDIYLYKVLIEYTY